MHIYTYIHICLYMCIYVYIQKACLVDGAVEPGDGLVQVALHSLPDHVPTPHLKLRHCVAIVHLLAG